MCGRLGWLRPGQRWAVLLCVQIPARGHCPRGSAGRCFRARRQERGFSTAVTARGCAARRANKRRRRRRLRPVALQTRWYREARCVPCTCTRLVCTGRVWAPSLACVTNRHGSLVDLEEAAGVTTGSRGTGHEARVTRQGSLVEGHPARRRATSRPEGAPVEGAPVEGAPVELHPQVCSCGRLLFFVSRTAALYSTLAIFI